MLTFQWRHELVCVVSPEVHSVVLERLEFRIGVPHLLLLRVEADELWLHVGAVPDTKSHRIKGSVVYHKENLAEEVAAVAVVLAARNGVELADFLPLAAPARRGLNPGRNGERAGSSGGGRGGR